MSKYEIFSRPIKVAGTEFPNRFMVAPMTMGCFWDENGVFNEQTIRYFTERAKGGFGTIVTGAICTDGVVDPYSALGPVPLQIGQPWIDAAKKLTDSIHKEGKKILAQLSLGLGRNYPGLPSPSENVVWGTEDTMSPVLSKEDIKTKIAEMIKTAPMMKESGFDGIEVHAMHWGYLLDQLGMAYFNRRDDEYGGPVLENRLRAAKEIVEGLHEVCGRDYPVGMRLGLQTFIKGVNKATLTGEGEVGRTLEEGIEIAKLLEKYGYDFLDCDTGTYDSFYYAEPPMYMPQGFMIKLAAKAKKEVSIPLFAGGRMQDYDKAKEALEKGEIDGVTIGRQSLADPYFAEKVMSGEVEKIRPCLGCNLGCFDRLVTKGTYGSCAVNPQAARESIDFLKPIENKKKVVVVGGGVAGMEAARTAALRGYDVTLFEASDRLGGHLREAGAHSFKSEVRRLCDWYVRELKDLPNIDIKMEHAPCIKCIEKEAPDAIILATGSVASAPKIPGLEKAVVSLDAINEPEKLEQNIVIVGGGLVGCEIALDEAKKGKKVTIVEALDMIMPTGAPYPNKQMMGDLLDYYKVDILLSHRLTEVTDDGVKVQGPEGEKGIKADTVVSAIGFKPAKSLKEEFAPLGVPIYEIGDATEAATIMKAVWDGYFTANNI